ncbi:MAG TPA: Gfo/Idh/MocA family oxidoreductase [Polyangiaceae bacterium]|jgi:predicted dehydrogenase
MSLASLDSFAPSVRPKPVFDVHRCLFVGLGGIGQRHLRNTRQLLGDSAQIEAYRVRRERTALDDGLRVLPGVDVERMYGVEVTTDLERALAQRPEVVFITNPTSLHVPVALAAAEAGAHLFIEKPLSHSLADVARLISLCEKKRLTTCVAYQLRHHPGFLRVQALLAAQVIGRVLSVRAQVGEYLPAFHPHEDYRRMYAAQRTLGGGVTLSQIHEIDYLFAWFGRPRRIFSMGGHVSSLDVDVDDVSASLLEFTHPDGGPLFVELHQDFVQRPTERSVTLIGERGKIEWSLSQRTLRVWGERGNLLETQDFEGFARNQAYLAELEQFFAAVTDKVAGSPSLREGAASLEVALALLESQASGRAVTLAKELT